MSASLTTTRLTGLLGRRGTFGLSLLLAASSVLPAVAGTSIRIGGTGSALASMRQIAREFQLAEPAAGISVLPSLGTTGGIRALQARAIDLAVIARPLTEAERASGLQDREYAQTPLVFATQLGGARGVSLEEVTRIYSGELTQWPDGTPIRLIRRPPTEADWAVLGSLSPQMASAIQLAVRRTGLVTAASDQDNAEAVESVRGSFGLAALGQIITERRRMTVLTLDGVAPSTDLITSKQWRVIRTLHLATRTEVAAEVATFAAFVTGSNGAVILAESGYLATGADRS